MSAEIYKEHIGEFGFNLLCDDRKTRVTSYWHHGKMHLYFFYCGQMYEALTHDYGKDEMVREFIQNSINKKLN